MNEGYMALLVAIICDDIKTPEIAFYKLGSKAPTTSKFMIKDGADPDLIIDMRCSGMRWKDIVLCFFPQIANDKQAINDTMCMLWRRAKRKGYKSKRRN